MRILLAIAALLAIAGNASATNEYGSIGFHRSTVGPGTDGCAGEPPAGCQNIDADYRWNVYSNDDAERPHVNACTQLNEPYQSPAPGYNGGAWYRDAQGTQGTGGGSGVCATVGDFVGLTILGGQGTWLGQDEVWIDHYQNAFVGGEDAYVTLGENGGTQTAGAGAWTYVQSGASGTCAHSTLSTPNGGLSVGPFCD